jgi:hypothetical protein
MSDGFRNQQTVGTSPLFGTAVLNTPVALPALIQLPDVGTYPAIQLSFLASGVSGGAAGLCQIQLLWNDSSGALTWVETIEINFEQVAGYSGCKAYLLTPVRGPSLRLSTSFTNAPTSPTLTVGMNAFTGPTPRVVCWQDAQNFHNTDLLMLAQAGGAIVSGGTAGPFNSGLGSGPVMVQMAAGWTTGGAAVGQLRARFSFGSSGVGWPDLFVTQPAVGVGLASSNFFLGQVPRRPVIVNFLDTGSGSHNTVVSYNLSIIRDEP